MHDQEYVLHHVVTLHNILSPYSTFKYYYYYPDDYTKKLRRLLQLIEGNLTDLLKLIEGNLTDEFMTSALYWIERLGGFLIH